MPPMGKENKDKKGKNEPEETSAAVKQNETATANEDEANEEEEEGDEEYNILDEMELPPVVLKRVKGLRKMHETYEQIEEEYKEQRLALEKSFLARKVALYTQRQSIIKGESDINEEGVVSNTVAAAANDEEKGIPSFWLTTLSSHPAIGELITEEDVPALEHLVNITCDYDENFTEFVLSFHFNENEFFTNAALTKKYIVSPDLLDDKSPALMKVDGTEIHWKQGKNLCVKEITKKQKAKSGRNKGQVRTVTRSVPKPSFFHYFDERSDDLDDEENEENEQEDENQLGRIKLNLDEDYDIGHIIRTSIIPEAILYFTGEAEMDDGLYADDEEGDEEEGDEEGEGEEDEDDEGEEEEGGKDDKKKKNKGGNAAGAAATGDKPPECKQN